MKLLALETSAKAASCAVLENGQVLAAAWQRSEEHTSELQSPM